MSEASFTKGLGALTRLGETGPSNVQWTEEQANSWYERQPWLVGANYTPSNAINQLEMWQADTFDADLIDKEFALAESLGMNTLRIYLHDLLWQHDPEGFVDRIDTVLSLAAKRGIRPMLVLFDSCWHPAPALGIQPAPLPGVHNPGWVQSPGAEAMCNPAHHQRLEDYIKGIVGTFAEDPRILVWDVWNEPDNINDASYAERTQKLAYVERLLHKVFAWARSQWPTQPLTSGVWVGEWDTDQKLTPIRKIQLHQSDVISFHNYEEPEKLQAAIDSLRRFNRPLFCTEYMARGQQSTFEGSLPIGKSGKVAMINWGLVQGKTQTHMPWDSWQNPYVDRDPEVWFHDIFHTDGTPYNLNEIKVIRELTGVRQEQPAQVETTVAAV